MDIETLKAFRVPMFADRETLTEALEYAYSLQDPAVTTAVHVVLNTVINLLTREQETVL